MFDENLLDNDYIQQGMEWEEGMWDNADDKFEADRENEFLNEEEE